MQGDARVIEYLNSGLRHELTAVSQFWLHYRFLDNWGLNALAYGFGYWGYGNPYYSEPYAVGGGATIDYSQPIDPSAIITAKRGNASNSSRRYGKQLRSSSGVGLFFGGAQRPADVMRQSCKTSPSSRRVASGCDAKPAR